ncbi:MAG: J domain-containing protein [Planctomycetota bacterium]|jgi:hypothetical protein
MQYDPDKDAYIILGADPDADSATIEDAYRRAAKTWHPDKSPAPDAAERFHELRLAAQVLRDPQQRALYDRLRRLHIGKTMPRKKRPSGPPRADIPLPPAPAWLADKVKVHFDSVIMNLKVPVLPTRQSRWADAAGFIFLVVAITARDIKFAALALVCLFMARVMQTPPNQGTAAWAKIVPGRKLAEYHALDRRADRYETWTIPYGRLCVVVMPQGGAYRIAITGFPHVEAPELGRVRSLEEARKFAREAGLWLDMPLREVA